MKEKIILKERKIIYAGIIAIMFVGMLFLENNTVKATGKDKKIEYIITARNKRACENIADEYRINMSEQEKSIMLNDSMVSLSADNDTIDNLAKDNQVVSIERDILVRASGGNIEKKPEIDEWNIDILNLPLQNNDSFAKEKIKVAIIDSGIDFTEDINVMERKNFVPGEDNVSVIYEDSTGHGTSIAGVIAAKRNDKGITGVNERVEIYSAKVLDRNNEAPISRIIEGIDWAITKNVDIINLSFGTKIDSLALHKVIKRASEHNILLVGAAGNHSQIEYPAAYPEVIAVGAVGTDGQISEESAKGKEVELVAPGEQVLSTSAFGGVMAFGGTSMAVPHVVGVASLLWEQNRDADACLIRMVLDAGAKSYGDKNEYGYGLVDYAYALNIFDKCQEEYQKKKLLEIEQVEEGGALEVNHTSVDPEEYKEVDYVEGLWKKADHQDFSEQSSSFTGENLKVLKIGTVVNDNYIYGMGNYPQWHGYFVTTQSAEINYVTCYIYLTKIAQALSRGSYSVPKPTYMSTVEYNGMKSMINTTGINGHKWSTILSGHTISNKNKMLIAYGMALHVATDTFAHSSFDLNGNRVTHPDADNLNYLKNRMECAEQIARTVLKHAYEGGAGTVGDYRLSKYSGGTNKSYCFKLKRIAKYIRTIDSVFYGNNKTYFDKMALSSIT